MTWFIYVETYQKTYYLLDEMKWKRLISSISESNSHTHHSFKNRSKESALTRDPLILFLVNFRLKLHHWYDVKFLT